MRWFKQKINLPYPLSPILEWHIYKINIVPYLYNTCLYLYTFANANLFCQLPRSFCVAMLSYKLKINLVLLWTTKLAAEFEKRFTTIWCVYCVDVIYSPGYTQLQNLNKTKLKIHIYLVKPVVKRVAVYTFVCKQHWISKYATQ